MSPSHLEMIGSPSLEMFGRSVDARSPELTAARSRSSLDGTSLVNQWLETQSSPYVPQSTVRSSSSKMPRDSRSSAASTLGKKEVRWASNLEDYDKYMYGQDETSTRSEKVKPILSKSKRRSKNPPVPEPPRSRGPPPAPRPRRLPTPDLPEIEHGDFCGCCSKSVLKMNTQLAAAAQHMAYAKHSVRY